MIKQIQKIKDETNRLKQKEKKLREEQSAKNARIRNRELQVKNVTADNSERFSVYRALSIYQVERWWYVLAVLMLPVFFLSFVFFDSSSTVAVVIQYVGFGFIAIVIARITFYWLHLFITFPRFKKWRSRLSFQLEGWQDLVDGPHFSSCNYWRLETTITLQYRPNVNFDEQLMDDLLFIFADRANKEFYRPDKEGVRDSRKLWKVGDNSATGSSNNQVVRCIYQFLKNDLTAIAKKYQHIDKVKIQADLVEREITPYLTPNEVI